MKIALLYPFWGVRLVCPWQLPLFPQALCEVLHQKDREIQRLESLSTSARGSWQQRDQTLLLALKEKEALIKALQEALTSSTKDVEVADTIVSTNHHERNGTQVWRGPKTFLSMFN